MKKHFLALALVAVLGAVAQAQEAVVRTVAHHAPLKTAAFAWNQSEYNFGTVPQGKPVSTTFTFTNTGSVPLIISQVQGSCGCTATDYSKEPIAPGKDGYVKATYNAASAGPFRKTVTITANNESGPVQLVIKGEVKP